MLSDSPPERDLEWTEGGIDGAWRFVQRLWRIADDTVRKLPAVERRCRKLFAAGARIAPPFTAVAAITDDIERFPSTRRWRGFMN